MVLERIERHGSTVLMSCAAIDEAGVAELVIGGQPIPCSGERETAFSFSMAAADQDSDIECRDVLGNRTTFRLTLSQLLGSQSGRLVAGMRLAGLFQSDDKGPPILRLPGLKYLALALALKLHREFPLVEGMVIEKQGDMIITDLTLDKLRAQRRILVYAEHPVINPHTQQPLGMGHEVLSWGAPVSSRPTSTSPKPA